MQLFYSESAGYKRKTENRLRSDFQPKAAQMKRQGRKLVDVIMLMTIDINTNV